MENGILNQIQKEGSRRHALLGRLLGKETCNNFASTTKTLTKTLVIQPQEFIQLYKDKEKRKQGHLKKFF